NIDSDLTWLNWDLATTNKSFRSFVQRLIAFRKHHRSIHSSIYWRGRVPWHRVGAAHELSYSSHSLALFLYGKSLWEVEPYLMINAYWEPLTFGIYNEAAGGWRRIVDTSLSSPGDFIDESSAVPLTSSQYAVQPRSVVLLLDP